MAFNLTLPRVGVSIDEIIGDEENMEEDSEGKLLFKFRVLAGLVPQGIYVYYMGVLGRVTGLSKWGFGLTVVKLLDLGQGGNEHEPDRAIAQSGFLANLDCMSSIRNISGFPSS
nr:hypothetical protein [Tanacetum cinerariifolium]